jgi:hypothetical protein
LPAAESAAPGAPGASTPSTSPAPASPYAAWKHGPATDPNYFPIAVWLQDPRNAGKFKAAGINLYIGLWKGPTDEQLAALKAAGMPVICEQNEVGLAHRDDPTIIAWMHGDEPDNAQALPDGKGYGPPIAPDKIVADYRRIRQADPTRPVILNLGQGVAWDGWFGRGVRTNHPEDYPLYIQGCDIVSFDIYPAVHDRPAVAGKLWYVGLGVQRLVKWADGKKIVWDCIECTRIGNVRVKPTPAQVRTEVWMSIIHGSRGLIYFVHQFAPKFIEAGLLADEEMVAAVTKINRQVRDLAPVINAGQTIPARIVACEKPGATAASSVPQSPGTALPGAPAGAPASSAPAPGEATVRSSSPDAPIDVLVKRHAGSTYVLAVAMRDQPATATVTIPGLGAQATAEVLGESRTVDVRAGTFQDKFEPYDVHIYRIR